MSSRLIIGTEKVRHTLPTGEVIEAREATIVRAGCGSGSVVGVHNGHLIICCRGALGDKYYAHPLTQETGPIKPWLADFTSDQPVPVVKMVGQGPKKQEKCQYLSGPEGAIELDGAKVLEDLGVLEGA